MGMLMQKQEFDCGITLYHGDCLEIMPYLSETVDMVLCDPPYGTTHNPWDAVIPFDVMWQNLYRITKKNAAMAFFCAQPFVTDLINSNRKHFRYDLVWKKTMAVGFLNAARMPLRNHELVAVFYQTMPNYFPQKIPGGKAFVRTARAGAGRNYGKCKQGEIVTESDGSRFPASVWECGIDQARLHPTQKPVDLLQRLIMSYTREGETVLDFTMGSGSTGVACVKTKRGFIGIEREQKYFDIACERIEKALAQGVLF